MTLYMFYGDGCPHCEKMMPLAAEVEENEEVDIERKETWDDEENAELMEEYDDGKCGGVPFFYNTESEEWICGETTVEELTKWVHGETIKDSEDGIVQKILGVFDR